MPTPVTWIPWQDRKATTRRGPHNMSGKMRRLPWPYCTRCGLLALRNEATKRALKKECEWIEDG